MNTLTMPTEFFQVLTDLESGLALAEQQAKLIQGQVEQHLNEHSERNSLMVHSHYLLRSVEELATIRGRFSLMRRFFVLKI